MENMSKFSWPEAMTQIKNDMPTLHSALVGGVTAPSSEFKATWLVDIKFGHLFTPIYLLCPYMV